MAGKIAQLQVKIARLETVARLQAATAISELLTRKFEETNRARLFPQRLARVWADCDLTLAATASDLTFHGFLRCRRDTQEFLREVDAHSLNFEALAELASALLQGCR